MPANGKQLDLFDQEAVDVALTLEGEMERRVEELMKKVFDRRLRVWVETRIQAEVAELGLKLGSNLAELVKRETNGWE